MNVLLMANHLNTGGIASYILTLSKGLTLLGHRVYVMTSGGNLVEKIESGGVKHVDLGFRTKSEADPRIYLSLSKVTRFIQREKIDVIHAHTRVTQVMSYFLSEKTGIPFVSTCHGFFKPRWFRRIFPCWGRKVIAISNPVKDHLINDFKVNASEVALIRNGIDLAEFKILPSEVKGELRARYNVKGGPIVGIIARLSDVKGHDTLIRAFADILKAFPQARLLIVGEGPEEKTLRALAEELGLSQHIEFFKIVNRTAGMLPLFDVFVMPSLQEGLGLSVMEAQAAGLPVVASRVGGLPDLIEHNRTGILVEPKDPKALAQAVIEVLQDPAKARDMGQMARLSVEKHYGAEQMVAKTVELYESVRHG
jgi:L-malate glycosyltransferase